MKLSCATCGTEIPAEKIFGQTNLAICPSCNSVSKIDDLYAAGVQQKQVEVLRQQYGNQLDSLPDGCTLKVNRLTGGGYEVVMPPKGFDGTTFALGGFTLFWLVFVGVWTWFASSASILFAAFSIPFWIAGFFMATKTLNNMLSAQKLVLANWQLSVIEDKLTQRRISNFAYDDISTIGIEKTADLNQVSNKNQDPILIKSCVLCVKGKKIPFFTGLQTNEMEWLVYFLNEVTQKNHPTLAATLRPPMTPQTETYHNELTDRQAPSPEVGHINWDEEGKMHQDVWDE